MPTYTPSPAGLVRSLSDEAIHYVLTSDDTIRDAADKVGCSRQMVQHIRQGRAYSDLFPELPRRQPAKKAPRFCDTCVHFTPATETRSSSCGLELPEVRRFGRAAGQSCIYHSALITREAFHEASHPVAA